MNKQMMLEDLLALLEAEGVNIRKEPLGGSGGGFCMIKGKKLFFVDTQAPLAETAALCADAVSKAVDIENIYVRPEVREFIEKITE